MGFELLLLIHGRHKKQAVPARSVKSDFVTRLCLSQKNPLITEGVFIGSGVEARRLVSGRLKRHLLQEYHLLGLREVTSCGFVEIHAGAHAGRIPINSHEASF